jgi:hypothetical protein
MAAVVLNRSSPDLFATWQEQIGRQRGARLCRGPRPFFHHRGYAVEGLIELGRLRIDVLYDRQSVGGRSSIVSPAIPPASSPRASSSAAVAGDNSRRT